MRGYPVLKALRVATRVFDRASPLENPNKIDGTLRSQELPLQLLCRANTALRTKPWPSCNCMSRARSDTPAPGVLRKGSERLDERGARKLLSFYAFQLSCMAVTLNLVGQRGC